MNYNKENIVKELIENSNKINSNAFNLDRLMILALTSFIRDGLQYRELKALLNVSDGKLQSDLNNLREIGYIEKIKVDLDNKKVTIFMIKDPGKKELLKIILWINIIKEMTERKQDV